MGSGSYLVKKERGIRGERRAVGCENRKKAGKELERGGDIMGVWERDREEGFSFPWLHLAGWRGWGGFRSCYFVSIGKRMTPDFLPYNNMLINPLGLLWSGKPRSQCLQELDGC